MKSVISVENYIVTAMVGEEKKELSADGEKTIYQCLREEDLPLPETPCGGRGRCGRCTVKARGTVRSLRTGEVREIDGPLRTCQYFPAGRLMVWLKSVQ